MTTEEKSLDSQSSKKVKRIESKKRKAVAFLQLAKDVEAVKASMKDSDDDDEVHTQAKKQKIPEAFGDIASFVTQKTSTKLSEDKSEEVAKPKLSGNALLELRKTLREKQKASMDKAKLFLTLDALASEYGAMLCKESPISTLPPLFMMDVQHLLLYAIQGNLSSYRPRWCKLLRQGKVAGVVVIVLDGVGSDDYQTHPESFSNLQKFFEMSVDMVPPVEYGSSVADELLYVPLSLREKIRKAKSEKHYTLINVESMAPIIGEKVPPAGQVSAMKNEPKQEIVEKSEMKNFEVTSEQLPATDCFPRTHLLLSTSQMVLEGFPMPNLNNNTDFVYTKEEYGTVTNRSPIFAVDCEMCLTVKMKNELTRVSLVNENLECIYDTFVKPHNKIRDYVTRYSGVTKQILDPVKTRLSDVQKHFRKILPDDAILVGQSLCGDLNALQMFHPYVMDTSVMYNLNGDRKRKTGLKRLTAVFLRRDIQTDSSVGHNSIEDATATMELVKLKLANDIAFGDCVLGGSMFPPEDQGCAGIKADQKSDSDSKSDQLEDADSKSDQQQRIATSSMQGTRDTPTLVDVESVPKSESLSHRQIIDRRRSFFKNSSNSSYKSLFSIVKELNKTAALVDETTVVQQHADQDVVAMESDCDRTSKSLTKSYVEYHDFVYTCFPSYKREQEEGQTEEDKKKLLGRMDKRLGKVLKHIRADSLVTVVLSGQSTTQKRQSAKTFIKIV